ncbi:MAG: hypothetical protein NC039_09220 [Muribaculaceae bacterium]|nr:hypothetical protein [Muribaculaceae bacterium]
MKVKKIIRTEIRGAEKLSPIEMNKIPFDTGHNSPLADTKNFNPQKQTK